MIGLKWATGDTKRSGKFTKHLVSELGTVEFSNDSARSAAERSSNLSP